MSINMMLDSTMLNDLDIRELFQTCKWSVSTIIARNLFLISARGRGLKKPYPFSECFKISQIDDTSYKEVAYECEVPNSIEMTLSLKDFPDLPDPTDVKDIFNRYCFMDALRLLVSNRAISVIEPESNYFDSNSLLRLESEKGYAIKIKMSSNQLERLYRWNQAEVTDYCYRELISLYKIILKKMDLFTKARIIYKEKAKELERKFLFNVFESEQNIIHCIEDVKNAEKELANNPSLIGVKDNISQILSVLDSTRVILNNYNHVFENVIRPIRDYGESGVRATAKWAIIGIIISLLLSFTVNIEPIRQKIMSYFETKAIELPSQKGDKLIGGSKKEPVDKILPKERVRGANYKE